MRISLSVYDRPLRVELNLNDIESIERICPSNDSMSWGQDNAKSYTAITLKDGRLTSQGASMALVTEDPSDIIWDRAGLFNQVSCQY